MSAVRWLPLVQIALIELSGPQGQAIYVNPHEVTSLREPRGGMHESHFAAGTRCVVVMTNGNILAVTNACNDIREKIETGERGH